MIPLGNVIIRKACRFIKRLQHQNCDDISVSINISVIQLFSEDFTTNLFKIIEEEGVKEENIAIEITESVIMNNFEIINQKLKLLQSRDIKISLDDFGTGYSSFSRLRELYIDILKIDKFFIDKLIDATDYEHIIDDIISLAHKLGLVVVSEGVEYEKQKQYLIKIGCDIIQGYYYSKPLKEEEAIKFLQERKFNDNREKTN